MMRWVGVPPAQETLTKVREMDAKTGYAALPVVALTGGMAGVLAVIGIPAVALLLNALMAVASGARRAPLGASLLPLVRDFRLWLILAGVAVAGMGAALLRRYCIRRDRFWYVEMSGGTARYGLDDLLTVLVGTPLLALTLRLLGSGALFWWLFGASPFVALILHAVWEVVYSPLIRRIGRISTRDRISVIMHDVTRHLHRSGIALVTGYRYDAAVAELHITIDAEREDATEYVHNLLRSYPDIARQVRVRCVRI